MRRAQTHVDQHQHRSSIWQASHACHVWFPTGSSATETALSRFLSKAEPFGGPREIAWCGSGILFLQPSLSLSEMNEMIRKIDLMRGSFPKPWHFKAKGAGKSPGMWIIVSSCSFYVLICLAPGIGKWTFSCHPCTEGCFLGGTNIPIKATSKTHGFVRMGCLQIYQILSSCSPSKLP